MTEPFPSRDTAAVDLRLTAILSDALRSGVSSETLRARFEVALSQAGDDTFPAQQFCGDYPAPCNCDDPNTHDQDTVKIAAEQHGRDLQFLLGGYKAAPTLDAVWPGVPPR